MTRDDELDMLSEDTQEWLADAAITVFQDRPDAAIDPVTKTRNIDGSSKSESCNAVREDDTPERGQDLRTKTRAWRVVITDLTFRPAPKGRVRDQGDNTFWRIVRVAEVMDGREYSILGERID